MGLSRRLAGHKLQGWPSTPRGMDTQDRERALERRASLSAAERDRVEQRVSSLLDLLGKAHTMALLREFAFADGPLRFSDIESRLDISPNTLSQRLSELVDRGLLDRQSYDEMPPRVEYRPTDRAEALFPAFGHFHQWAMEYELDYEN
ncbi:transcriptional regulator [Halosegnis longus]|uniref:Transcriptional regulator n=2 Tax=Halosegnis longus TaxID=2216012 RepID=A0AAJ4UV25_9EURY|nr:transcriptional regulator [Salella cibi]